MKFLKFLIVLTCSILLCTLNCRLVKIEESYSIRKTIAKNKNILYSIAKHSEDDFLLRVYPVIYRDSYFDNVEELEKDNYRKYWYVLYKDSTKYEFMIDSIKGDNYRITYVQDSYTNNPEIIGTKDSLLFIRSISDNYSLCRLLAENTDTFFMSYWSTKWIRNRAFLSIDFYLNGKTYSVIKTTQNINSSERIERIDHLFDDWYLLQEKGNHFVGD